MLFFPSYRMMYTFKYSIIDLIDRRQYFRIQFAENLISEMNIISINHKSIKLSEFHNSQPMPPNRFES